MSQTVYSSYKNASSESILYEPIPGYEGYYVVSPQGEVFSLPRVVKGKGNSSQIRKAHKLRHDISKGYHRVTLFKENVRTRYMVHRLVAMVYVPNPCNKPEVNHIDGDKDNNDASNLEWVTSSENQIHAFSTGLQKGKPTNYKLTEIEVEEIKRRLSKGERGCDLSKIYGVSQQAISNIKTGSRWGKKCSHIM